MGRRSRLFLPVFVGALFALLSVAGWQLARGYVEAQTEITLAADAVQLETEVDDRLDAYVQVLYAGVGLYVTQTEVDRAEWRTFFTTLRLNERYAGFQGLGYAELIPPGELEAHEARVRAEGFPDYVVRPPGERDVTTAIVYLEPFEGRNLRAFGYDMYSDPVRREAMARARDTGAAALSGAVTLVQENGTDVQQGFLLYAPVYAAGAPVTTVEERRAALQGWVYAPFRAGDFMDTIIGGHDADIEVSVYDGPELDPAKLLYGEHVDRVPDGARVQTIESAGRPWVLVERPTAAAGAPGLALLPLAVLTGGLIASGLVFAIVLALASTQARAETIAEEMTGTLRARTVELQASNEALRQFSYVVSHDLKEPVRGIDVYLRVLEEDHGQRLEPEARDLLASARGAADRMTRLLSALLELSRAERADLAPSVVHARELVQSAACRATYETLERERGAIVEVGDAPPVLAAPSVLAQALGNLIANGIRHNASTPPRVRVRGEERDGAVDLVVEDNGPGYSPGLLAGFARGRLEGGGFGLLLARQSAERLGGRLTLGRSADLGGAAARLTLPAADADEADGGSPDEGPPRTPRSSSASR